VIWGVLLSTRLLGRRARPKWLLDLHRFLGGLAVVFVGVHVGALLLDTYVPFGLTEVLVPFASTWKPGAVAWGIVGFYILIAVEITSLLMKHLPRKVWHTIHLGSFGLFVVATLHLLTAGTDATNPIVRASIVVAGATVAAGVAWALERRPRADAPRPDHVPILDLIDPARAEDRPPVSSAQPDRSMPLLAPDGLQVRRATASTSRSPSPTEVGCPARRRPLAPGEDIFTASGCAG
jgi:DMSO/TMAO reductase YedYZ heme-binding membrane subunit